MKMTEDSKCTIDYENNWNNRLRVKECSSMNECYNSDALSYDDSLCPKGEKCAKWKVNEVDLELEGCIKE